MQACEHQKENLTLYVYGELDPVAGRKVENHLENCEGCRHEYQRLSTILDNLELLKEMDAIQKLSRVVTPDGETELQRGMDDDTRGMRQDADR